MSDVKISQLPVASNLQASDIAPYVSGGITTQASASQVVQAGLNATPVTIAQGGTGQVTASAALTALLPTQTGQTGKVLGTNGTVASWVTASSGTNITIVPDSTTATAVYPAFVEATSGTVSALNIDNTHLSYIPSTGELSANGMTANNGLFFNAAVVNTSVTVPAGFNALSAGPVVTASGVTVTVNAPSTWKVV